MWEISHQESENGDKPEVLWEYSEDKGVTAPGLYQLPTGLLQLNQDHSKGQGREEEQ